LIKWYAKFQGRKKPFEAIASPELRAMMEPLQAFLAKRLEPLSDGDPENELDVVFSWDSDGLLGFSIAGGQAEIANAISLIGERAEFRGLDS
jgi:hypothetical protein